MLLASLRGNVVMAYLTILDANSGQFAGAINKAGVGVGTYSLSAKDRS